MKLGRRLAALFGGDPASIDADEPCIPCGEHKRVRQFSLNPPAPREVTDHDIYRLVPGGQFAVVDGQVVLYDPARIRSHVLNASAATVWAAVDGQRTVAQIIDVLEADTGVDRATLGPDVRHALGGFVESRIVTDEGPAQPGPAADPDGDRPPAWVGERDARVERWAAVTRRRLDQRRWTVEIGPVRAAGVDVIVRSDEPTTAAVLTASLAALAPSPGPSSPADGHPDPTSEPVVISAHDNGRPGPSRYRVYVDGRRQWRGADPDDLLADVLSQITLAATSRTVGHLLWHAGGVERDGRVVAVTGQSGQGKSTLTAALVRHGFAYLTDELLAVDPANLSVLAYPKALDLDRPSCDQLGLTVADGPHTRKGRQPVPVARLGAASPGGQLALIVLLDDEIRGDQADASAPVRDVLDLVGVTFRESFADQEALQWLATVAETVPTIRVTRGPVDQMVAQVMAALAQ